LLVFDFFYILPDPPFPLQTAFARSSGGGLSTISVCNPASGSILFPEPAELHIDIPSSGYFVKTVTIIFSNLTYKTAADSVEKSAGVQPRRGLKGYTGPRHLLGPTPRDITTGTRSPVHLTERARD
jgi:hypothetical protein